MGLGIVILEDNEDRRAAMADRLEDRFPQYPITFFATAAEAIWHLRRHLPEVIAVGLDHDLDLVPVAGGALLDPGSGRDVADYLASEPPACPVVIATTNGPAGDGMERVLGEAGWAVSRVTPYGDLEWVSEAWFRAMRDAIVASALAPQPASPPTT